MDEKPCAHCWHGSGYIILTLPPQTTQVCCFCGAKRVTRGEMPEDRRTHGKHLPGISQRAGEILDMSRKSQC